jgi:phage gp36-like protein
MSSSTNVLPEQEAINYAASWRTLGADKLGTDFFKGFLIPMEDLTQIINKGCCNIRVYIGNDSDNGKHLLIVGVDEDGKDLINYEEGYYVYDFTEVCPEICDETSVLCG